MDTTISYTLTPRDIEEWLRHNSKALASIPSKSEKKNRKPPLLMISRAFWIVVPAAAVGIFIILHNPDKTPTPSSPIPSTPQNSFLQFLLTLLPWGLIVIFITFFLYTARKGPMAKKFWEQHPDFQQPQTVLITTEAISFKIPTSESRFVWNHFLHFYEAPTVFLLFNTSRAVHIIPKRAFSNPAFIDKFRQFCLSRILKVPPAFPIEPTTPVI